MKFDFIKHRNKFFIISILLFVIGFGALLFNGLNLGVDFVSGTRLDVESESKFTKESLEKELQSLQLEVHSVSLSGEPSNRATVIFREEFSKEEIKVTKEHFSEVYGAEASISTVSSQVGKELAKNAIFALLLSLIGIVIYLTIRFEIIMATAATIALIHDALFVIMVFSLFQIEVSITFIAAILTIVGYSINDTVVTFDRIRENMKIKGEITTFDELAEIVNISLQQTLKRSINTVLTVMFAAVALLILGSPAIWSFSLALVIGLLAGTYSSLFIAAQLWAIWKFKQIEYRIQNPKEEEEEDNDWV